MSALGKMENHSIFILFLGCVLIIFWHAVWELVEEFTTYLSYRLNVPKRNIYIFEVVLVILLIELFPQILKKI